MHVVHSCVIASSAVMHNVVAITDHINRNIVCISFMYTITVNIIIGVINFVTGIIIKRSIDLLCSSQNDTNETLASKVLCRLSMRNLYDV
jgi:acyl-[acyl carrier protein]--UDP-N-acetylglucosamine O-acyltransferase